MELLCNNYQINIIISYFLNLSEPEFIPFGEKENVNQTNLLRVLAVLKENGSIIGLMRLGSIPVITITFFQLNSIHIGLFISLFSQSKTGNSNKSAEGRMYILKAVNLEASTVTVLNPWRNTGLLNGKRHLSSEQEVNEEKEYDITLQ